MLHKIAHLLYRHFCDGYITRNNINQISKRAKLVREPKVGSGEKESGEFFNLFFSKKGPITVGSREPSSIKNGRNSKTFYVLESHG
jgi:hypothetical protein